MSYPTVLINKSLFEIRSTRGTVISEKQNNETHVYSTGGGTDSPTVKSYVIHKHNVWIKTSDGREERHRFVEFEIDIRDGHELELIYIRCAVHKGGWYLASVVNHTIGREYRLPAERIIRAHSLSVPRFLVRYQSRHFWESMLHIINFCMAIGCSMFLWLTGWAKLWEAAIIAIIFMIAFYVAVFPIRSILKFIAGYRLEGSFASPYGKLKAVSKWKSEVKSQWSI